MALKPLVIEIVGDVTGLERALGVASKNLKGLVTAVGSAGTAVAIALTAMTQSGLAAVDANAKLARSIDGTVSGLRAVQIAAGYAGVEVSDVNSELQSMARELSITAMEGGPAVDVLKLIGLSVSDLIGLDADKKLALIADRMHDMGLSAGQASAIMQRLGVDSKEMALLMTQGGDAIRSARDEVKAFGLELTDSQISAVESANDAMSRMSMVFDVLRDKLAVSVAPALQSVADQFTKLSASASVQEGIERLAASFGALAETVLTEDFIGAVMSGFENLASISATVADGLVTVSQNVEVVTIAFGALAIAVAAAGGPITVVVGALALALGGIAAWRSKAEDAAIGSTAAAQAQNALNAALGTFSSSAGPDASKSVIDLANDNYAMAESALAAAQAEIAKNKAIMATKNRGKADAGIRRKLEREEVDLLADLAEAEAAYEKAIASRKEAARVVVGSDYVEPESKPTPPPELIIPPILSGSLQDELDARLETLQAGLMTEREFVETWYAEGLDTLNDALEAKMLTEAEYMEARERLEKEHQERLSGIRDAGNQGAFTAIVGAGQDILNAIGQTNSKAAKAAKALGAFEATVNAYRAAAQALADPSLSYWQKFSAAASALAAGLGFASSISGMSDSGGGGGGGGGAPAATAAAPAPLDVVIHGISPDTLLTGSSVSALFDMLSQEAGDRGVNYVVAK